MQGRFRKSDPSLLEMSCVRSEKLGELLPKLLYCLRWLPGKRENFEPFWGFSICKKLEGGLDTAVRL